MTDREATTCESPIVMECVDYCTSGRGNELWYCRTVVISNVLRRRSEIVQKCVGLWGLCGRESREPNGADLPSS